MSAKRSRKAPRVRRITVDERLADDLIRVVVCELAEGVKKFWDRQDEWGGERDLLVRPRDYVRRLGIPPSEAPSWEALEEGQVFLSGEFEVLQPKDPTVETGPAGFRVSRGKKGFLRIDDLDAFREGFKGLYTAALTRG